MPSRSTALKAPFDGGDMQNGERVRQWEVMSNMQNMFRQGMSGVYSDIEAPKDGGAFMNLR